MRGRLAAFMFSSKPTSSSGKTSPRNRTPSPPPASKTSPRKRTPSPPPTATVTVTADDGSVHVIETLASPSAPAASTPPPSTAAASATTTTTASTSVAATITPTAPVVTTWGGAAADHSGSSMEIDDDDDGADREPMRRGGRQVDYVMSAAPHVFHRYYSPTCLVQPYDLCLDEPRGPGGGGGGGGGADQGQPGRVLVVDWAMHAVLWMGPVMLTEAMRASMRGGEMTATRWGGVGAAVGAMEGTSDGGPHDASFWNPIALAVDPEGIVYVTEQGSSRVRRVSMEGNVTVLAGSPSGGYADGRGPKALFRGPWGIVFDKSTRTLVVSDSENHRIRRVTLDGTVTTIAGSSKAGSQDGECSSAQFNLPRGVCVDSTGAIYVADSISSSIRRIKDGMVSTITRFECNSHPMLPTGIKVDSSGNMFFLTDPKYSVVMSFNRATKATEFFTHPSLVTPMGLWMTPRGDVYVVDCEKAQTVFFIKGRFPTFRQLKPLFLSWKKGGVFSIIPLPTLQFIIELAFHFSLPYPLRL
ncbi:NHL repeat protein [Pelomyxa schiedti]|nr:NHL repeat protein [Pelomyxa schiedti]